MKWRYSLRWQLVPRENAMLWLRTILVIAGIVALGVGSVYTAATPQFLERFFPFSQNTAAMGFLLGLCAAICLMRWVYLLMRHDGWTSSHLAAGIVGCACAALHLLNYSLPEVIDPRAVDIVSGLVITWTGVALGMTGLLQIPNADKQEKLEHPRKPERGRKTAPRHEDSGTVLFDDDLPDRGKVARLDTHRRRKS